MVDWDDSIPRYLEAPVYFKTLLADVPNGTFIMLKESEQSSFEVLGRIVKGGRSQSNQFTLNVFFPLSHFLQGPQPEAIPIHQLQDPEIKGVAEVVQSKEQRVYNADELFYVEVAFVFNEDDIRRGVGSNCQGITNAYLCRFRVDAGTVEPTNIVVFPSREAVYSTKYITCYASRIWKALVMLQKIIRKGINRYSERQGNYARHTAKVDFPEECWQFIRRRTADVVEQFRVSSRELRERVVDGFKSETLKIEHEGSLLRFETESQLEAFRATLGLYTTYGVRRRRARIGFPKFLHENDTMNAVIGSEQPSTPFRRRTGANGIDLLFDSSELTVTIRYERYVYTTNHPDGLPAGCHCAHLTMLLPQAPAAASAGPNGDGDDHDDDTLLVVGAPFKHGDYLLQVRSIRTDEVVCHFLSHLPDRRNETITFQDKAYVEEQIEAYNS